MLDTKFKDSDYESLGIVRPLLNNKKFVMYHLTSHFNNLQYKIFTKNDDSGISVLD